MMKPSIAVVGLSCRYPDARSPDELWENVLAGRRAFRRMPNERLRLEDYLSEDRQIPDTTYSDQAAVIEGYEFDRARYRIAGSTYREVDLAHWLALDVAADALADAGYTNGDGLPCDATAVLVGNSLTGEFSRANLMRLRWPYVRRVVDASLSEQGWSAEERADLLRDLEQRYKAPFPAVGDDTLAGGLSNTIAGRICNQFDLHGGGYTVDGACASSLLAVATACTALTAGDADVVLAGGVDLSLDPFELIGFSQVRALATDEMRVYDARSEGFWPGEGCGFAVLMRQEDAVRDHRRIHAVIRGWGVSSDGSGGITRPEIDGQLLALRRAYRRAPFGPGSVPYFEGHGTGTAIGDATELRVLSRARREASPEGPPAVVGSIKANIGHTKAAAGLAGLIKATKALESQVLPPNTGWSDEHPAVAEEGHMLRALVEGEAWPAELPLRAGVSAMGFGGINVHIAMEGTAVRRRKTVDSRDRQLLASHQDAELFAIGATDRESLIEKIRQLSAFAQQLSRSELTDLAAELARQTGGGPCRAAVIASLPKELDAGLETLGTWLAEGVPSRIDVRGGVMLNTERKRANMGLLFPGQGTPPGLTGGLWYRRFESVRKLYNAAELPSDWDGRATEVAQPAIVAASLAGLHALDRVGFHAVAAAGHSLGELTAFHWAGAMDEPALLRMAAARGQAIALHGKSGGAMASIAAGQAVVEPLIDGQQVVLAGLNSPQQTVVSGEATAIGDLVARAKCQKLAAVSLQVSHAFHSPLVTDAGPALLAAIADEQLQPLRAEVASTITGTVLESNADLRELLLRQMTSPVRLMQAVRAVADRVDLWVEVGPGHVMQRIARNLVDAPIVSLDSGGSSLRGLCQAVGAAFVLGAKVNVRALFDDRFTRPFDLDWQPKFFVNPCELAPEPDIEWESWKPTRAVPTEQEPPSEPSANLTGQSPLEVVRQLVAQRAELPLSAVGERDRLLNDLHLSSLAVGQLVSDAARALGLTPSAAPTDAANASVADIAQVLAQLAEQGPAGAAAPDDAFPAGADTWTRAFAVELVERPLPVRPKPQATGKWHVVAPNEHPLRDALQQAFEQDDAGDGVIVCLPPNAEDGHVEFLLEGARLVLAAEDDCQFVLVQHGGSGGAFARSLHLELPRVTTCVVDVPIKCPAAVDWIVAEARSASAYVEAHYDRHGVRREPLLSLLDTSEQPLALPLDQDDLLLVTGGGKGIASECALALAKETGARLVLLGRSQPDNDEELSANLKRMKSAGVEFRYVSTDVTDADAVRSAVEEAEHALGPVTTVLHGAGSNVPQRLGSLDRKAFARTLGPKVEGLKNLLAAVDPARLRLLVTFGSIIARTGMHGQADYAVANDRLARMTETWQREHPQCRCVAVEWSVWSGVGMGERLGTVDSLARQGITPITTDEGLGMLRWLIGRSLPQTRVVVAGRFGNPPTLKFPRSELPLRRFLERPRVHVPGVELVVEADLSTDTDPYLIDHVYQGVPLFLAVMGLEAMAQAAMALTESEGPPTFEQVGFEHPIVVPEGERVTIRIAAILRGPDRVEVVLRSQGSAFQMDHFRAICRFATDRPEIGGTPELLAEIQPDSPPVPINAVRDLYDGVFFHRGRFQRVSGYRHLRTKQCLAEITAGGDNSWFGQFLPDGFVLGDPAARDAIIHAIQACIPQGTLLPIGVERIIVGQTPVAPATVRARERSRDGEQFVYDLEVADADGRVTEVWDGLVLRRVSQQLPCDTWCEPLLGPYLERRLDELLDGTELSIAVERAADDDRRRRSDRAIRRALAAHVNVHRRSDGRPEVSSTREVSVSHADDLTLAVAAESRVACDAQPVTARTLNAWRDLLGADRLALATFVAEETDEPADTAATRVWGAVECLTKAGVNRDTPLVFETASDDGWVLLAAGPLRVATVVVPVRGAQERIAFALCVEACHAGD